MTFVVISLTSFDDLTLLCNCDCCVVMIGLLSLNDLYLFALPYFCEGISRHLCMSSVGTVARRVFVQCRPADHCVSSVGLLTTVQGAGGIRALRQYVAKKSRYDFIL